MQYSTTTFTCGSLIGCALLLKCGYAAFDMFSDEGYEVKSNAFNYCTGTPCYTQDECCTHTACIKKEGENLGRCTHLVGQPEGGVCLLGQGPPSCQRGMRCHSISESQTDRNVGMCVMEGSEYKNRGTGEKCKSTLDCEFNDNLCCRSRMHGRAEIQKICDYYEDMITDCIFMNL